MKYTSLNYNNYDAKFDLDSFEEVIEIAEPTYYLNEYWLVLGVAVTSSLRSRV